jgi:hypothetical protein
VTSPYHSDFHLEQLTRLRRHVANFAAPWRRVKGLSEANLPDLAAKSTPPEAIVIHNK